MDVRKVLKDNYLIFDGAFGTYYSEITSDTSTPELANVCNGDIVKRIHMDYINAGADVIRTNTFASNTRVLAGDKEDGCKKDVVKDNIYKAIEIARSAVKESGRDVLIAGSIGPVPYMKADVDGSGYDVCEEYIFISSYMVECGVDMIVFETFSNMDDIIPAIDNIKKMNSDIFVVVEFCVNQFGYSNDGIRAQSLINQAADNDNIDATGFNCGVGPGHLYGILKEIKLPQDKYITALPNASYPRIVGDRMKFMRNEDYFLDTLSKISELGIDIVGGCCGTRPDYIKMLKHNLKGREKPLRMSICSEQDDVNREVTDDSFFLGKSGKKLMAVELSPPLDTDYHVIMDAANALRKCDVDIVTLPDSPSGRTRADSVLMADKVAKETGLKVMPHICCRDKNAIAMRSQLLGAYINDITNFLVITGDPVPTLMRQDVKSVFNFDSCGLMKIIKDMNEDVFKDKPLTYGGAINHGRANIQHEINRVKKKMSLGASFFFTQPVFSKEDIDRVNLIKESTGARILYGLMPLVSKRNALFIKNEITGINVTDEIINMFDHADTKQKGEDIGVSITARMMKECYDKADGFYFSIPFNRVYLVGRVLDEYKMLSC